MAVIARSEERTTTQSPGFSGDCFSRASLAMTEKYKIPPFDQLNSSKADNPVF